MRTGLNLFSLLLSLMIVLVFPGCGEFTAGLGQSCVASFITVPATAADVGLDVATTEVAQSFKASTGAQIASVKLKLIGVGAPTGSLILKLESNGATSSPDGVPLSTVTVDAASISKTAADFVLFTFPATSLPTLTKDGVYWLRLKFPTGTTSDYVRWIGNNDGAYSDGAARYSSDGTNWSAATLGANRDFLFLIGC